MTAPTETSGSELKSTPTEQRNNTQKKVSPCEQHWTDMLEEQGGHPHPADLSLRCKRMSEE